MENMYIVQYQSVIFWSNIQNDLLLCFINELETCNKLVLLFLQERLLTLKKQAAQISQQAQREKESFLKERSTLEGMLQRVRRYPCLHVYAWGHPFFCV